MNEEQDVLDPRRQRRRTPAILLGTLPVAIAATLLVAGPNYATPAEAATSAGSASTVVSARAQITPGLIAPSIAVDAKGAVQKIIVTFPKPKVVAPAAVAVSVHTKSFSGTKASSVKKVVKSSTTSYKRFCANPSNPVSASGSTGKALLHAVNKERAKLGIRALSWSSSMASTATSWSKKMAAKDAKTSKLIDGLAHNPNRPGAENVAVVYSSAGYSAGTAIKKMHKNLVYSQGHCLNLMNPKYSSMGSGVAKISGGKTWYATENFR